MNGDSVQVTDLQVFGGNAMASPMGGMSVAPVQGVLMGVDNRDARMMAQSLPRNEDVVRQKLIGRAAGLKGAAVYSWRVNDKNSREGDGKTTIEGPSIKLAMTVAQLWGNCTIIPVVQERTPSSIVINAIFVDLETGFKVGRLFEQSIQPGNFGKMDSARAMDMNFQIAQSKAIRNVICAAIPEDFFEDAIQAAKTAMIGDNPDRILSPDEMSKVVKGFEKFGVTRDMLVRRIGRAAWTATDKAAMTMVWQALAEGMTSVEAEFSPPAPAQTPTTTAPAPEQNACQESGTLTLNGEVEPSERTKGTSSKA